VGLVTAVRPNQELWALALWVDCEHVEDGEPFIAERVLHFDAEGDESGKQLWMNAALRYVELKTSVNGAPN
jgi:hypothetical protein